MNRPEGFDFPKPLTAAKLIENQVIAAQHEERRRKAATRQAIKWVAAMTSLCYVFVFTPVAIIVTLTNH